MDESKKDTVVSIIRALWKKDANILDLRSGHFYLHLLEMLEQWDKAGVVHSSDEDRLMCTKIFLQDYYGNERETRIDDFLKFDAIMHEDKIQTDHNRLELELCKIAIVLLGIGVLDKNSQNFMAAVLRVPLEKHYDVLAIIQSVVQAGSSEVALTSRIEEILCEPAGNCQGIRPDTPNCNLLKSMEPTQASTPKDPSKSWTPAAAAASSSAFQGSPLRLNLTLLNSSLRDITSPLRGLSIDASSSCSPLTQYAQSPQLIQKAILRQKETELRKLKRQMEEHIDRADELKYLLQDQTEAASQKDTKIIQLEKKVQELQRQNLQNELTEKADEENRNTIDTLTQRVQSLEHYKTQYLILEKESSMHAEEIRKLYCEITGLEQKNMQYKSMVDSHKHLEEDIKDHKLQLNTVVQQFQQMQIAKKEWETERQCMQEKISSLKEQISSLRHELEDFNPLQLGNTGGETMGVILDIQVEELKCELNETKQEQEKFQSLLEKNEDLLKEKEKEVLKFQNELCVAEAKISEADKLVYHQSTNLEQQNKKLQDLKEQLEQHINLKSELQNSNASLQSDCNEMLKQCSDYTKQIASLEIKLQEKDECMEKLKSALEQKDYELRNTQELLSCKDKQLEKMRAEVESLTASNITLSKDLSKKDDTIVQLQQDCDKAIKESHEKQAKLKANIDEIKESTIHTLSDLKSSHAVELLNIHTQHETVVRDIKQAAEQHLCEFHAIQKLLTQKQNELDAIRKEMKTVSDSLQSKTEQLKEKEEYIFKVKTDCEKQLEEMDQNKCELQALIAKLQKELDEMLQQFQRIEKELVLKTGEVCRKEEQIHNIRCDFENKAKVTERNSKEALELLKAELEAVKNAEIESFSKQIETQINDAEEKINVKEIQLEKLERTVKELISEREALSVKLEESDIQLQETRIQLDRKSMDIADKEEIIKGLKQDSEKKLLVQESNEKTVEELQEKLELLKETNTQALRQKETHHESEVSKIKLQHEKGIKEMLKTIEEKDNLLTALQKTIANKNVELEKFGIDLESEKSALNRKNEEFSSCKQDLIRLEKLVQEKERLIESVKGDFKTQISMNKSNYKMDLEANLKNAEHGKEQALSEQKISLEAEMTKQKKKHEEEVQKLVQANENALESHKAAQRDAEWRAEEQLTKEREEHGKLLEALGQDLDKERKGYLQSLVIKRQEVEQLSMQLKDLQTQLISQEQQSVNSKEELVMIKEEFKIEKEKHSHDADLLQAQLLKNQEIEEKYKSLHSEMEQLALKLTQSELNLERANEFSNQLSNDLDQAKSNMQKVTQDLIELQHAHSNLEEMNEHLQIQLNENSKLRRAETQSLKNNILEKETQISALTDEAKQKDATITVLQQTLSDQNVQLETLSSTLDSEKKNAVENKELIYQLQNDIVNKEQAIDEIKKNFEKQRVCVERDNQSLIDQLELKYKAAKECELQMLSDQKAAFKTEVERLKNEKDQKLQELIKDKSCMETENQKLKHDLDTKTQQHSDKTKEMEVFVRKASETYDQLSSMKQTLEEKNTDLETYQQKVADTKRELQTIENELQLKVKEVGEKEQIISGLKDDFAKEIYQLKSESKDAQLEIQTKYEEILKNEIAKAAEQQIAIEYYKQQLEELNIKYKTEVTALTEEITQLHLKIKQLEEGDKFYLSQQKTLQNLVKEKEEKAEQLYLKIQDLEQLGQLQQSQCDQSLKSVHQKEEELATLRDRFESCNTQLCQQRELLNEREQIISKCQLKLESYELQINLAKKEKGSDEKKHESAYEQNVKLEKQVTGLKRSNEFLIEKEKKSKAKLLEMATKYESIQKENKQYASEVNKLKTALDFSERKLRESQRQLDTAGTALLGDSSHFQKVIAKSSADDSLVGSPDSIGSSRSLRSRTRLSSGNISFQSSLNETILSGDTVLLKRETIASSADLKKRIKPSKSTEDRTSICSTFSSHSTNSTTGMPGVHMPFAACANEPEGPDFEWDRLSELQRRNTMYLPHLKSAYPVEMQTVETEKLSDEGLRLSTVANQAKEKFETRIASRESKFVNSGKATHQKPGIKAPKRNAPVMQLKELSEPSPPKQLRTAPNYHRPGPPTPGKQPRRVSGAFSPDQTLSPASTGKNMALGSPITRAQGRLTPGARARRSPRLNASPATSKANNQDERRQSVAFNIGFSPMANTGQMKPPRQAGLMPKKKMTKSASTVSKNQEPASQKFRRPLGTHNFLETGI